MPRSSCSDCIRIFRHESTAGSYPWGAMNVKAVMVIVKVVLILSMVV